MKSVRQRVEVLESAIAGKRAVDARKMVNTMQRLWQLPEGRLIEDRFYERLLIHPPYSEDEQRRVDDLDAEISKRLVSLARQQGESEDFIKWMTVDRSE